MNDFLGDQSLLALEEGAAKGTLVASRPRYVREEHGEEAHRRLAEALSPEARVVYEQPPLPFTWTPMTQLVAIDRAIVEGPMRGEVAAMRRFGELIARYDLPVVYKVLFRVGSPSFVIKRIGMAYAQYLRGGKVSAEASSQEATVWLERYVQPLYLCAYGIPGWIAAALTMSGGEKVTVTHETCAHRGAARCEWRASWR